MKQLALFLAFLGITAFLPAQITIEPEEPGLNDPITLTFDATQGNSGLEGYEGDVYVHTGLITDQSTSKGDWQHVVSAWGVNKPAYKLERIGPDKYRLQFTIQDLYGIGEDGKIAALAFVFRNETGTLVGKAAGDADIFYLLGEMPDFNKPLANVLEVGQAPHPDWAEDATLYEVNVRQYTEEGTFDAFAEHLPRLKNMGVDILWFMPIQPIGQKNRKGKLGSYYAIKDYTDVNPEHGDRQDFRELVEKCHQMGFKVVLDWVANHTAPDHVWVKEHPEWFFWDDEGEILPYKEYIDVTEVNFEKEGLRDAMIEAMKYWVTEMNIDGFRCDHPASIPVEFWNRARKELEAIKLIWMLAEDESRPEFLNEAFNANYGWHLHFLMNEIAEGKQTADEVIDYMEKVEETYPEGTYPIQFLTNHDENSWKGTISERLGEGHKAFAVLSYTAPGMPLIYSGQEAGLDKRLEFFEKDPIDWSNIKYEEFYTKLNQIKAQNPAIYAGTAGGSFEAMRVDKPEKVLAFTRTKGDNRVAVLLNLSDEEQAITLRNDLTPGVYADQLTGDKFSLNYRTKITLAPWEHRILKLVVEAPEPTRKFRSLEQNRQGIRINTQDGALILTPYSNESLEVTFEPLGMLNPPSYALATKPAEVKTSLEETDTYIEYTAGDIRVKITKDPMFVTYYYRGETLLDEERGFFERGYNQGFRFRLDQDEKLLGGGERVLGMDRRGQRLRLYNKPSYGYETEANLMYYSLPIVLSSKKYMLVFDNGADGFLDLGATEKDILEFEARGGRMSYLLVAADDWQELATNFTGLTGRQPLLPRWAYGNFASRMGYHSQQETEMVAEKYLEDDIPLDAIVLDLYWFGKELKGNLGNLDWHRDSFPEPIQMMSDLKDKGVNTILITEPFINEGSRTWEETIEKGLVGKTKDGDPYIFEFFFGTTTLLDIFKPETQDWFWNIYKKHTKDGVAGWWGDLGEPEVHPDDMVHVNGLGYEVHNLYGHIWAKTIFDGYRKDFPDKRPVILMRSGFVGSQRYGMLPWSGDVNRTWGGFKPQVEIGLSMALQGLGYMHSDLGGFAGEYKDSELYLRWLQYGIFQPVYRTHAQEEVPAEPIFWDDQTKDIARKFIKLRYALMPYHYTVAYENATKGLPMMRPLYYAEDNLELWDNTRTYLWGENFLVSPVTDKGAEEQEVYLPAKAHWTNFWTDKTYKGGQTITTEFNLETFPVFVRAGSFIPMVPEYQSALDYSSEEMDVHYFHDPSVSSSTGYVYEDDGQTMNAWTSEQYETIHFTYTEEKGDPTFSIRSEGYDYPGKPAQRQIDLILHNLDDEPKNVFIDGKKYRLGKDHAGEQGAFWDPKSGDLVVKVVVKSGGMVGVRLK